MMYDYVGPVTPGGRRRAAAAADRRQPADQCGQVYRARPRRDACRRARRPTTDTASPRSNVRDTGPGMSPEVAARIFDPFVQGDESLARKHGGTGLGLSIARGLAQRDGWRSAGRNRARPRRVFPPASAAADAVRRRSRWSSCPIRAWPGWSIPGWCRPNGWRAGCSGSAGTAGSCSVCRALLERSARSRGRRWRNARPGRAGRGCARFGRYAARAARAAAAHADRAAGAAGLEPAADRSGRAQPTTCRWSSCR